MTEPRTLPESDLTEAYGQAGEAVQTSIRDVPQARRAGLIVAIDTLYDGACENDWVEAERLAHALGWPEFSMDLPDREWVRARLDELLIRG